jgi:hypothetical protein
MKNMTALALITSFTISKCYLRPITIPMPNGKPGPKAYGYTSNWS